MSLLERAEVSDLIHHREHSASELAKFLCLILCERGLLFEFAQTGLVPVIIECEKLILIGILEGDQRLLYDLKVEKSHSVDVGLVDAGWQSFQS